MKKIPFFLITWLLLQTAAAQEYQYVPFPDSNAVWSEVYWKPISEPCPRWVYNKYALFNEDTVITGITYHKLFHTNATEITIENSEYIGAVREDNNKRIYVRYDDQFVPDEPFYKKEFLLYDFGLNVGDTLWGSKDTIDLSGFIVVKSIDLIEINNTIRKVYSFESPYWVYWIEGIGNVKGVIFTSGDLPTNRMDNDLVCFHHNDTLLYYNSDYDGCVPSFVLDGVSLFPNPDVKVYPNPASDGTVYFENLDFEWLELFDSNGCTVLSVDIKGQDTYTLPVSQFPPGIYFYRLKTKGLVPTAGRLIIQ